MAQAAELDLRIAVAPVAPAAVPAAAAVLAPTDLPGPSTDRSGGRSAAGVPDWVSRCCTGPFVDRHAELARLEAAFEAAATGSRVVGVSGEDGIGKSRLVAEAARRFADGGALVLGGQCHADRSSLAPFRQMLDRYAAQVPCGAGEWPATTASTLGALSSVMAEQLGVACQPQFDDPYAAAAVVISLIRAAGCGRPAVLVLDDLHLADLSTLEAVRQLVEGHPDLPLLVLLVFRGADARLQPDLLDLLDDLHRVPDYQRIPLGPLPSADGADLLAQLLGRPTGTGWEQAFVTLDREVGGKPRFLLAVARAVDDCVAMEADDWVPASLSDLGLPRSLHDLIRRRLRALPTEHRAVLDAASVVGSPFGVELVARLADCCVDTVMAALEWLRVEGLVRQADLHTAEFTCEAVRLAVCGDLPTAILLRLRSRLADAVEFDEIAAGSRPAGRRLLSIAT